MSPFVNDVRAFQHIVEPSLCGGGHFFNCFIREIIKYRMRFFLIRNVSYHAEGISLPIEVVAPSVTTTPGVTGLKPPHREPTKFIVHLNLIDRGVC